MLLVTLKPSTFPFINGERLTFTEQSLSIEQVLISLVALTWLTGISSHDFHPHVFIFCICCSHRNFQYCNFDFVISHACLRARIKYSIRVPELVTHYEIQRYKV